MKTKKTHTLAEIVNGKQYTHQIFGEVRIVSRVDWPEFPSGVWKVYSLAASTEYYAFNVKYFDK